MEIIKKFLYPNKNDILDPLSLVIKLFIYSYKPLGTKISILNNKIIIQDIGIFQSSVRSFNGDTKNDLINMLFPLTYACEIYLSKLNHNKFKNIFEQINFSFDKLNTIYQINEIAHNIEQLKNIVGSFLVNSNENENENEYEIFNPITIISNWDEPASILKKSFYKQTNSIWTPERLDILSGYIQEIFSSQTAELKEVLIISLASYMNYIDLLVVKLIENLHLLR